jgi:hypothetical protein
LLRKFNWKLIIDAFINSTTINGCMPPAVTNSLQIRRQRPLRRTAACWWQHFAEMLQLPPGNGGAPPRH